MKLTFLTNEDEKNYVKIVEGINVGQTVVVKTVDENGKPTEWEAVDIPEVPEEAWEDLASATIAVDDAVSGAYIDTGLTFGDLKQYKEIIIRVGTPNSGPNLNAMHVLIKTGVNTAWYGYPFLCTMVSGVKSGNVIKVSFANSQKTIWSFKVGVCSSYDAMGNDIGATNPFLSSNRATPHTIYEALTYHKCSNAVTDSDPIQFYFSANAPADIRYKITGVFK